MIQDFEGRYTWKSILCPLRRFFYPTIQVFDLQFTSSLTIQPARFSPMPTSTSACVPQTIVGYPPNPQGNSEEGADADRVKQNQAIKLAHQNLGHR